MEIDSKSKHHQQLAEYFTNKPLYLDVPTQRKPNTRKLVEQPWQQVKGECWKDLIRTLCDLSFVETKCSAAMTDNLLADYSEASKYLTGEEGTAVSVFRKFTQNNASYLRNHAEWCLQLAIIEPHDSPVGKEARQLAESASIPCLEPVHHGSSITATSEMRYSEHTKPVQVLAFDRDRRHLLSSDGEEVIRWDTQSSAIVSRFKLPVQDGVADTAYHGSSKWKIAVSEQAAIIVAGNILVSANSGHEIRTFVNQRTIDGKWMAPPAISPDARLFALCTKKKPKYNEPGSDHTVTIISGDSGRVIAELPHTGTVNQAVFSPDAQFMVTVQQYPGSDQAGAGGDDMLYVWDVFNSRKIHEKKFSGYGHVSFSSDGKILLADSSYEIYSWATTDWSQLNKIYDRSEDKFGSAVVDTTYVITWGYRSVTLWNTQTSLNEGRLLFDNSRKGIYSVALSPDHKKLVIGHGNGLIEMWSLEELRKSTASEKSIHEKHTMEVASHLLFSPDGKRIAVSYSEDLISTVDLDTNTEIASRKLFFQQDNPETYQPKDYQTNKIESLHFTPDGKSLILMLISTKPDKTAAQTPFGYKSLTFGSVRRISATDMADLAVYENKDFFQFESSVSPDGNCVFVMFSDKVIQLNANDLTVIKEHNKEVRVRWALSPDGSRMAYRNTIWSFAANKIVFTSTEPSQYFSNPVFSPDGILIPVNTDNKIHLVNTSNNSETVTLGHSFGKNRFVLNRTEKDILFSPDGRKLLLTDAQTISVLDIRTGRISQLGKSMHISPAISCRFSADGQFVFGVEKDFIKVWHSDSGIYVALLPLKSIEAFDWNPSGTLLGLSQSGRLQFFRLLNTKRQPSIVTGKFLFQFKTKNWQKELTVVCPDCGVPFVVPSLINDMISRINMEAGIGTNDSPCLKLPDKAWDEPGLVSSCPNCMNKIRFNPFIAGNKNQKPKWKFW